MITANIMNFNGQDASYKEENTAPMVTWLATTKWKLPLLCNVDEG